MQERSEAERRANGHASMLLPGEATEPYNKYANLFKGPHFVRSFQAGCLSFVGTTLSQECRNILANQLQITMNV